jgi:pyruvate/2-oxoacid:ferredoxin oxidoreductase beta subunit
MDPDLMTDEQLAERDRVLITCTGCGETYGYAIATIAQQRAELEALARYSVAVVNYQYCKSGGESDCRTEWYERYDARIAANDIIARYRAESEDAG